MGSKPGKERKLKYSRLKARNFWGPLEIHPKESFERPYEMFPSDVLSIG